MKTWRSPFRSTTASGGTVATSAERTVARCGRLSHNSAPRTRLASVALGTYDVTAWTETNGTEGFQFTLEAGDTASAALAKSGSGAEVELTLVVTDTSAARLARVEPIALDGLELSFSDTLPRTSTIDLAKVLILKLSPEAAPAGTPLDSIPQTSVIGDTLPVVEVRRDTLQPKTVVVRLGPQLADSSAYAVRVGGVVNTAGLVSPDEPPFVLFRTRVLPDSLLSKPPAADSTAAPGGKPGAPGARKPGAAPRGPAPPGAPRPQTGREPPAAPVDTTGVRADTTAVPNTPAVPETTAVADTTAIREPLAADTTGVRETIEAPADTTSRP